MLLEIVRQGAGLSLPPAGRTTNENPMSALILRWWRISTSREMGDDKEKRHQGRIH